MNHKIGFLAISAMLAFASCKDNKESEQETQTEETVTTPTINYTVTNVLPHDTNAFTEGFLMHDGKLYESTGATEELPQTRSLFGEVDLKTGKIVTKAELDRKAYFGEGIVFLNDKVYQLTYQTKVGFIYDAKTFKRLGQFTFPSKEGWGMTTDGKSLIMSDGTNTLTWLDPENFHTVKTVFVTNEQGAVQLVNELEYINGFIYANIYTTAVIIKIDPATGKVVGKMDMAPIAIEARNKYPQSLEMNGIAYDSTTKKVLVTGKMWPHIYEISLPL